MIYSHIKHYKFYIKKDKLSQLEKYGFIKNDSSLFSDYLYVNRCETIQNRIYVHKDLHLSFGNINSSTLNVIYKLIKENILESIENIGEEK
jgi:hypothetical protein